MTTTVAKDTRPPMPPPKGVSRADNLPVSWVAGWRWAPGQPGFFYIGPTMYRLDSLGADAVSESWHVSKLVERPGRQAELALPFTVCIPVPGSAFAASCDCPSWRWSKESPRRCKHETAVRFLREQLEVHEPEDDMIDRMEREQKLMRACPCTADPLSSRCGTWEGNVSLCVCADDGLAESPAPS